MSRSEPEDPPTAGETTLERAPDGTLVVRLSGAWRLQARLPSTQSLERELGSAPPTRVTFDSEPLGRWDTSILLFVERVLSLCADRGIPAERDGLPPGLRRLLGLTEVAPEHDPGRAGETRPSWLARVGAVTLDVGAGAGETLRFVGETTLALGRLLTLRARIPRGELGVLVQQCGAQALPIVSLIAFLIGLILAFMGAVQLARFGASIYVADLVGLAMVREMGAVMTAIVMAGRTGAAFAAQIGTMKVTEEIDALSTFGFSPMEFLVLPRVLALTLTMPLLTLYADFLGILGGLVVAAGLLDLSLTTYVNATLAAVSLSDLFLGIAKGVVFGVLVALAGCLRGLQCGGSASAVGDAATSAVVTAIVLIIVVDGVFAVACHLLGI